jgi:hypothetical protein
MEQYLKLRATGPKSECAIYYGQIFAKF